MRRALFTVFVLLGLVAAACTAFDFPSPGGTASDAAAETTPPDATTPEAGPAPSSFLDTNDAARLCTWLFQCPHLSDAIALSIALPLDLPSSPLAFSACMDWVAGPVDPERLGLTQQRALLAAVAAAPTCEAAGAALPVQPAVQPADAGTCGLTCADPTDLATCSAEAGTFLLPCAPPYFGQSGACFATDAGALCVSTGACTAGLSCSDPNTLRDCLPPTNASFVSYVCTLTARQCASPSKTGLADCVLPGHDTAPCPLHDRRDACDGTSVLACAGGLTAQTEFDCSAVGRTCTVSTAGDARCVGPTDTCTPFDADQSQCSGTAIRVCIGGVPSSYDCSAIGKSCVAGGAGQTAHCGSD
jgi:hypothetical protein